MPDRDLLWYKSVLRSFGLLFNGIDNLKVWKLRDELICRGRSSAYKPWHDEEGVRGAWKSERKRTLSLARENYISSLLIRS